MLLPGPQWERWESIWGHMAIIRGQAGQIQLLKICRFKYPRVAKSNKPGLSPPSVDIDMTELNNVLHRSKPQHTVHRIPTAKTAQNTTVITDIDMDTSKMAKTGLEGALRIIMVASTGVKGGGWLWDKHR